MKVEQLSSSDKAKLLSEMIGVPVTDSTLQVFKDALAHLGVVTALALNNLLSIVRKLKETPGFDSVLMRVKGNRSDMRTDNNVTSVLCAKLHEDFMKYYAMKRVTKFYVAARQALNVLGVQSDVDLLSTVFLPEVVNSRSGDQLLTGGPAMRRTAVALHTYNATIAPPDLVMVFCIHAIKIIQFCKRLATWSSRAGTSPAETLEGLSKLALENDD